MLSHELLSLLHRLKSVRLLRRLTRRLGSSYWLFAPGAPFLRPHWRSGVNPIRYFAHMAPLAPSGHFGVLGPVGSFWAFWGSWPRLLLLGFLGAFFRALRPVGLTGPETLLAWGRLRRIGKTSLGSYFTAHMSSVSCDMC